VNKKLTYEELIKINAEQGVIQLRHEGRIKRLENALEDTDNIVFETITQLGNEMEKNRHFIKEVFKEFLSEKHRWKKWMTSRDIQKAFEGVDQRCDQLDYNFKGITSKLYEHITASKKKKEDKHILSLEDNNN